MRSACSVAVSSVLWLALVCGCIPSEPQNTPDQAGAITTLPNEQPGAIIIQQSATTAQHLGAVGGAASVPAGPQSTMRVDMDKKVAINVGVQVAPMKDGLGYTIRGSFGLAGTITKAAPEDPEWTLAAEFAFETGGYIVGAPYVTAVQDMVIGLQSATLREGSGEVLVNIPITMPPKDATLAKGIHKVPVSAKVRAGKDARFTILLLPG